MDAAVPEAWRARGRIHARRDRAGARGAAPTGELCGAAHGPRRAHPAGPRGGAGSRRHAQRRAAQADDTEAFVSADADFHNAIIRSAGNTLLTTFAEGLRQRQQRVTATSIRTPERMTAVVARHERLAAAIAAGDADAFRTTLDAHFEAAHGVRAGTSPADQTAGAAR
ncbi:FCD domain-containing protein [Microbacterium lacticum]